mmetsp:Transcript_24251/g.38844  ORF Transcript_24251/g.38844 Transcript_24251/m.38844 type:complete len:291 (-) Transcript_24251:210-1082(-)
MAEEGGQRRQQRSHGPLSTDDCLLVGLLQGANVHGHEEPGKGGQSTFFGPRNLSLPQPPFHASEGQRHKRRHHWRWLCRAWRSSHALKPAHMIQRPTLIHRDVHSHGVFWWAPKNTQNRHPGIIDKLHREAVGIVRALADQLFEGPVDSTQNVCRKTHLGTVSSSEADHVHVASRRFYPQSCTANKNQPPELAVQSAPTRQFHRGDKALLRFPKLLHVMVHGRQHFQKEELSRVPSGRSGRWKRDLRDLCSDGHWLPSCLCSRGRCQGSCGNITALHGQTGRANGRGGRS